MSRLPCLPLQSPYLCLTLSTHSITKPFGLGLERLQNSQSHLQLRLHVFWGRAPQEGGPAPGTRPRLVWCLMSVSPSARCCLDHITYSAVIIHELLESRDWVCIICVAQAHSQCPAHSGCPTSACGPITGKCMNGSADHSLPRCWKVRVPSNLGEKRGNTEGRSTGEGRSAGARNSSWHIWYGKVKRGSFEKDSWGTG